MLTSLFLFIGLHYKLSLIYMLKSFEILIITLDKQYCNEWEIWEINHSFFKFEQEEIIIIRSDFL